MKKTYFFFAFAIFFFACKKKEEVNPNAPLSFQFRLLDANGNPSTQFKEGENFTFSFVMSNGADSAWSFQENKNFTQDFCRVFDDKGNDFGRPFEGGFCAQETVRTGVSKANPLKLEIPWIVKDSTPYFLFCKPAKKQFLKKGHYKTSFNASFEFQSSGFPKLYVLKTDTLRFGIDFLIN
jgi:hypothetical protein